MRKDYRIGERVRASDWEAERKPYLRNVREPEGVIVGIDPTKRTLRSPSRGR